MHDTWKTFLSEHSAHLDETGVVDFGDAAGELAASSDQTVLCDLSHRGLICVAGEDAAEFLQGQLTNDIHQLEAGHSHVSAYCDHKGRMLALFRLWRDAERFYLSLPAELVDVTVKRLGMFLLRSKAAIEVCSDDWVRIGIAGAEADTLLAANGFTPPGTHNRYVVQGETRITRLPGSVPRYEIHTTVESATELWTNLAKSARPVGRDVWTLQDIRAVQPDIFPATRETFTPQMLNLEVIDGVSFTKGCYTGQEVVARTQFLGTIKRRTYAAHVGCDTPPAPGTELVAENTSSGQAVGRIVMAAPSPEGGCEALAMVQISARTDDTLHLGTADGPVAAFTDPPYSLQQLKPGHQ